MKRHLLIKGGAIPARTACGLILTQGNGTVLPHLVDCNGCKRSIHMADAEIRLQQPSKRALHSVKQEGERES